MHSSLHLRHSVLALQHPFLRLLGVLFIFGPSVGLSQGSTSWRIKPSYETNQKKAAVVPFSIRDAAGVDHVFYDESNAILVVEGAYRTGDWADVSDIAAINEKLLREALESRHFHVVVWRDLNGSDLRQALDDAFSRFGYLQNSLLFFYYFGHGKQTDNDVDSNVIRTFLVPVDAPDPVKDEAGFYRKAFPISQLVEYSKQIIAKHAFFALEACRAGSVIASLGGGLEPKNSQGYLLNPKLQRPIKYFLTAGSADQDIAAKNAFTPLLVGAFANADLNHDGYVTASELINYVSQELPKFSPLQFPEHGSWPYSGGGDIVFGPADPTQALPQQRAPVTAVSTVNRDWLLPGLNVDCNKTKAGTVEAVIDLNPDLQEKVVSVSASFRDTDKIQNVATPVVLGPPGSHVPVKYSFNGLDSGIFGCPGGGHATLAVTFTVEQTRLK
jgi:Caspase domain